MDSYFPLNYHHQANWFFRTHHRTPLAQPPRRHDVHDFDAGILVIVLGAELFYEAEIEIEGSLIHSFADSLWWTITTLTTVGYGDIYPVSPLGRGVAATLMLFGIALYGSVTTMITQLLARSVKKSSEELERSSLTKELDKKIRAADLSKTEKEVWSQPSPGNWKQYTRHDKPTQATENATRPGRVCQARAVVSYAGHPPHPRRARSSKCHAGECSPAGLPRSKPPCGCVKNVTKPQTR